MRNSAIRRSSDQIVGLNDSKHMRWYTNAAMIHLRWLHVRKYIWSFSKGFRVTLLWFLEQKVPASGEALVHKQYDVLSKTLREGLSPCTKPIPVWTRSKSGTTFFDAQFPYPSNSDHIAVPVTFLPVESKRQKMVAYKSKGSCNGHCQTIERPNKEA